MACGVFPDWDQACVSCIGRWILYHWATVESPTSTPWSSNLHFFCCYTLAQLPKPLSCTSCCRLGSLFGCLPGKALGVSIWEREWEGQELDEGESEGAIEVLRGPHRISQGTLRPELCCPSGGLRQLGPYDFWKSLDVSYSGKGVWLLSVVGLCSWSIPWRGRKLKVICTQQAVARLSWEGSERTPHVHQSNCYHLKLFLWPSGSTTSKGTIKTGVNTHCLRQTQSHSGYHNVWWHPKQILDYLQQHLGFCWCGKVFILLLLFEHVLINYSEGSGIWRMLTGIQHEASSPWVCWL